MNFILHTSSTCREGGRGSNNPKILWTSLMDAPLLGSGTVTNQQTLITSLSSFDPTRDITPISTVHGKGQKSVTPRVESKMHSLLVACNLAFH